MGFLRMFTRSSRVASESVPEPPARRRSSLSFGRRRSADPKGASKKLSEALTAELAAQSAVTVALLGCDNAGKTTLAAALKGDTVGAGGPPPTTGFNNLQASREACALTLFDLGGGPNIRGIWPNYYADAHAAVFVVDASAPERFAEAATLLREASSHPMLRGKPMLVLANKQDRPQACSGAELAEAMRVHELDGGGASCQVGAGCIGAGPSIATPSELDASLGWLLSRVRDEYTELGERIAKQKAQQDEADRAKKEARKARLAAKRAAREKEEAEAAAKAAAEPASGAQALAPAPTDGVDVGLPKPEPPPPPAAPPAVAAGG
jgi:ADP-ribosylation factor-like protein 13B